MKLLIFFLVLCANPLYAQQPSISYLMCDEAKSQLQIRGSFGVNSGSVTIEDTTLGIVSWSDSLIICSLPDSGKGAGGHVEVKTVKGVSNERALSIFSAKVDYLYWGWSAISPPHDWFCAAGQRWSISWRADIGFRTNKFAQVIPFEISKKSFGNYIAEKLVQG